MGPLRHRGLRSEREDLNIPEQAHGAAAPVPDAKVDDRPVVLRMRITPADVHSHGPTHKCSGCRAVALKLRSKGHTEACRARIMRLIGQTPEGAARVQEAEDKITEELARRLEADAVNIDDAEEERSGKRQKRGAGLTEGHRPREEGKAGEGSRVD